MRARTFFQYCKEMTGSHPRRRSLWFHRSKTYYRWLVEFYNDGRILMVLSLARMIDPDAVRFCPLSAVAVDILGYKINNLNDVWSAALALELNYEFAELVLLAASPMWDSRPAAQAVREELVGALTPHSYKTIDHRSLFAPRDPENEFELFS